MKMLGTPLDGNERSEVMAADALYSGKLFIIIKFFRR